jgi:hypothetical protein
MTANPARLFPPHILRRMCETQDRSGNKNLRGETLYYQPQKVLAVWHESSARHRQGLGFLDPSIESFPSKINAATDDAASLTASARIARPVKPRHKKGFNADISRCTQSTQMVRCG